MRTLLAAVRKHRLISLTALTVAFGAGGAWGYLTSTGTGAAYAGIGALGAPAITSASSGAASVTLQWSAVTAPGSGSVEYYVTRDGSDAAGNCRTKGSPGPAVTCTDTGVGIGRHTYEVIAVWRSWTAGGEPQAVTVSYGTPVRLAFTTEPGGATAGNPLSTQPVVTAEDASGNTVADYSGQVQLSIASGTGSGSASLSGCAVALDNGVGTFSGCEIDTAATGYRLHATDGTLSADSTPFDVTAAAVSKLVFTTSALSGTASSTASIGPAAIQEQDRFGNPTMSPLTVQLSSDSPGAAFAATPNGSGLSAINIPSGSSSTSFYYGDAKAGTPTITAHAGGSVTDATQQETIAAASASKLVFTSASLNGAASSSANLGPATIQEQDQFGNPTTTAETVTLSSTSNQGVFAATQNGTAIPQISIPGGSSSVSIYYGDKKAGAPTITAHATGLTPDAAQQETITHAGGQLVLTGSVNGAASATASLGAITVTQQDAFGNLITDPATVSLSSNSTGTSVFSTTKNGTSTTTIGIPSGASSATFYYGDTKAGTPTVTAQASGMTSGTQQETVTPAAPSNLWWTGLTVTTGTLSACTPFSTCSWTGAGRGNRITGEVIVTDQFGNEVSNLGGGHTVSVWGSAGNAGTLTIASSGPAVSTSTFSYTTSTGNSWTSDPLTAATQSGTSYTNATVHITK